jgi:hypothetical protein
MRWMTTPWVLAVRRRSLEPIPHRFRRGLSTRWGRHRPTGTRSWLLRRPRPRVCPLLPFWVTTRVLVELPAAPVSLHSE